MHMADESGPVQGTATSDGRALAWSAVGAGTPAVLLEAGLSGSSAGWSQVAAGLAAVTRVVSYDRAGYGSSAAVEPTPAQVVADVDAVLAAAGVDGPVVLVGHSWGGLLTRLYCAARPDRVAGVVLVDATHEDLPSVDNRLVRSVNHRVSRLQARRARSGRTARDIAAGKGQLGRLVASVPQEHRPALITHLTAPGTWEQTAREVRSIPVMLAAARTAARPATPVVALVGGLSRNAREAKVRAKVKSVYDGWLGAEHVQVVPRAGHGIPVEAPERVVQAVAVLVQGLRGTAA